MSATSGLGWPGLAERLIERVLPGTPDLLGWPRPTARPTPRGRTRSRSRAGRPTRPTTRLRHLTRSVARGREQA
jgi:hypothetical protein